MEIRQYGICIGTRQWKENDRMLSLFCEDGLVYDVLARGALKSKYKLKFAAQLFSTGEYCFCPSKAGYYILEGAGIGELSFLNISAYPAFYAAGCLVCEAAGKCVVGENKRMYAETVAALGELSGSASARADLVALRALMATFATNGLGANQLSGGNLVPVAERVASAKAGEISLSAVSREDGISLVKKYAAKFASRFGRLNSLDFLVRSFD